MTANCDGRYHHYLQPMAVREPPDRIVCVDPYSIVTATGARDDVRTERFLGWSAVCLRRKDGRLDVVRTSSGTSTAGFWLELSAELTRPGVVWVVSWQCSRAWSLIGMWAELESGRARVSGGDYRAVSDPDQYARNSRPGLLVAEDTPNLAQLRIGHGPGQALWLDCRNWGVELDDGLRRGRDVAGKLASVVMRLDDLSEHLIGASLAPTVAGQSWRGWRATIAGAGVHCHVHPQASALERAAHVGGRCEAFRMGKIPYKCYHLDIRSCYGAVMCQENFPVRLKSYTRNVNHADAGVAARREAAIARVTIETNVADYPYHKDGDIIYPIGRFTTTLCGRELAHALGEYRIKAWHELAVYDTAPVLLKFAALAYAERCRADEAGDKQTSQWAKSLINGLPGKLGYKLRCWQTVTGALAPEPWGEWHMQDSAGRLIRWRALGGVCQREVTGGYGPDAVPAMAAWISSHGRFRLLTAIRTAGRENTVYVDTDALIVSVQGLHRLQDAGMVEDGGLGKLELRASNVDVEVLGIKHYKEGEQVKCAGFARGVATQSPDGRGQWYTPAAAEGAREGEAQGSESAFRPWPKAAPYRHGVVGAEGVVTPIVIRE